MPLTRITATNIGANAVTANSIGYTPVNKAGDTLTGTLVAPAINVNAAGGARALITTTSGGVANNDDVGGVNWRLNNGTGAVLANIYYKGDSNATSSGAGKLILGARANDGSTTPIDQLLIDAAGRVTKPNQPSFLIRKTTGQTGSGGATFVASFDAVRDNIGSHYSTSTNTFTAPVAGRYLFTTLLNINRQSATYFSVAFQINGAGIANISSLFYSQPSWTAAAQTIIVNLAVNDAVRVIVAHDSNATLDNTGYFSGMLLG